MIDQHLTDRESFARESTIEPMKRNMFLKHDDAVLIALEEGSYSFYNIVEDESHRFVTNSEKTIWNSKSDKIHSHNTLTINNGSNSIVYDRTTNKIITIETGDTLLFITIKLQILLLMQIITL